MDSKVTYIFVRSFHSCRNQIKRHYSEYWQNTYFEYQQCIQFLFMCTLYITLVGGTNTNCSRINYSWFTRLFKDGWVADEWFYFMKATRSFRKCFYFQCSSRLSTFYLTWIYSQNESVIRVQMVDKMSITTTMLRYREIKKWVQPKEAYRRDRESLKLREYFLRNYRQPRNFWSLSHKLPLVALMFTKNGLVIIPALSKLTIN